MTIHDFSPYAHGMKEFASLNRELALYQHQEAVAKKRMAEIAEKRDSLMTEILKSFRRVETTKNWNTVDL